MPKVLDVTSSEDFARKVPDIKLFGDPDTWVLLCKASSADGGWMKSTKAMLIEGFGVVLQVSTQQGHHVAEALVTIEHAYLQQVDGGTFKVKRAEAGSKVGRKLLKTGDWVP